MDGEGEVTLVSAVDLEVEEDLSESMSSEVEIELEGEEYLIGVVVAIIPPNVNPVGEETEGDEADIEGDEGVVIIDDNLVVVGRMLLSLSLLLLPLLLSLLSVPSLAMGGDATWWSLSILR